jgi:hypothetical protein
MPDQKVLDAAQNAELDTLISTAIQLFSASTSYDMEPQDQEGDTTSFGQYKIDNKNKYKRYTQLSLLSPHTFIPLAKTGLSIVSGFRIAAIEGTDEAFYKEMLAWADKVDLRNKMQNIARCMVKDGTTIAYLFQDKTDGITSIQVLPMEFTTLLPKGIKEGAEVKELMRGDVDRVILMESKAKAGGSTPFKREEIALFRLFHEGYTTLDILGRETYGMYGISLLEPLTRTLKNLADLTEGFSGNMRRYGAGRLHINLPQVEKLRSKGEFDKAKNILESTIAAMQKLSPNEDIITGGAEVNTIPGTHSPQVTEMKAAYEMDIHIGLLQSGVSMGDTKGSTYASGYLAEEDRYIILESIQEYIRRIIQVEIIDRQLVLMNKEPGSVIVEVDKLDIPYVDYPTLTDAVTLDRITEGEYRLALGFTKEKPEESTK